MQQKIRCNERIFCLYELEATYILYPCFITKVLLKINFTKAQIKKGNYWIDAGKIKACI